jgi:hypothetical protein
MGRWDIVEEPKELEVIKTRVFVHTGTDDSVLHVPYPEAFDRDDPTWADAPACGTRSKQHHAGHFTVEAALRHPSCARCEHIAPDYFDYTAVRVWVPTWDKAR